MVNHHRLLFSTGCLLVLGLALSLSGCVMKEQYEAEKSRALNFQRLLAQEEKRTGELDAEIKRLKRDLPDLEARHRELSAQLQAVREQMARVQEENAALREAAAIKAKQEAERAEPKGKTSRPKPKVQAAPPKHLDAPTTPIVPEESPQAHAAPNADLGTPIYHEVKPGDTLFRLSRQYGVQVEQIKEWNGLRDNLIEVGQKLLVGYQ
ncbi:LysM peptidoglycan-binding domain-containing protein [Candidatus Nitrospira bockiana]